MKKYMLGFLKRGFLFSALGPIILTIVWISLYKAGVIETLNVTEVAKGIISTIIMTFVAAGITIIYQKDTLPKPMAGLIHCVVLYIDYLVVYLINGWIKIDKIWIFSLIFLFAFIVIWFIIFISIKVKVDKMNKIMEQKKE